MRTSKGNPPSAVGTAYKGRSETMGMGRRGGSKAPKAGSGRDLHQYLSQTKKREPKDVSISDVVEIIKERKQHKSC